MFLTKEKERRKRKRSDDLRIKSCNQYVLFSCSLEMLKLRCGTGIDLQGMGMNRISQ